MTGHCRRTDYFRSAPNMDKSKQGQILPPKSGHASPQVSESRESCHRTSILPQWNSRRVQGGRVAEEEEEEEEGSPSEAGPPAGSAGVDPAASVLAMTGASREETPPTEEPKMEIHKPKAVHNWRELLTEIGVIVIGIAIALCAEQGVEWLHNRAKAAEARASIRGEIEGNISLISLRAATEACIGKRLDEVSGLIAASSDGKVSKAAIWIGKPRPWAMPDARYKAATQSGAVSLFDGEEQASYGVLYTLFATYFQFELKEGEAWADLRMLEGQPPPSPALDVKLRSALQQARSNRWALQELTRNIRSITAKNGFNAKPRGKLRMQSTCLPLQTSRADAQRMLVSGLSGQESYDEP
jgi:hypothetical protein